MNHHYQTALDKIKASESFKLNMKEQLAQSALYQPKRTAKRAVGIIAAALAAVLAVGAAAAAFAGKSNHSFVMTAYAETADEQAVLSESEFAAVSYLSATAFNRYLELDLSDLYAQGNENPADAQKGAKIINSAYFAVKVEGEGIASVTYSVNNGKLRVSDDCAEKLIDSDGQESVFSDGTTGGFTDYDAVTTAYDNQFVPMGQYLEGDDVRLCVVHAYNPDTDRELLERLLALSAMQDYRGEGLEDERYFKETMEAFLNELYADTEVKVTARFTDGREVTKTLALQAECTVEGTVDAVRAVDGEDGEQTEEYPVYSYSITLNAKIKQ